MAARKLGNTWWADFAFDHTRYRIRSPDNSRAGARAYEIVLRQRLARGEDIGSKPLVQEEELRFEVFARRWYRDYVVCNNRPSEQAMKRYVLAADLVPFFGSDLIVEITARKIEQFKVRQQARGIGNKTINNHLTILSKCLATAYEWLALDGNPPRIKRLKCPPPRTDYLSEDECAQLLSYAHGLDHELILTALRTGMRQSEIIGLQWSSIDWQTRILTVRHSRCKCSKKLLPPKSNRERHVPLDNAVYRTLYERRRKEGFVFLGARGRPLGHEQMGKRLRRVCERAGLRRIGWHTLRHTFASHLAMKGAPLNAVQTLLGHTSITTTMRYAHVAPSALRSAVDLLGSSNDIGQGAVNRRPAELERPQGFSPCVAESRENTRSNDGIHSWIT